MARKTSQICPNTCASSLQLSETLSTKRLKTCSRPTMHMAAKMIASRSSMARSMRAKTMFTWVPSRRHATGAAAEGRSRTPAPLLLRADLRQQGFRAELLGQLVLRRDGGIDQRLEVDLVDLHAQLLHLRQRLILA